MFVLGMCASHQKQCTGPQAAGTSVVGCWLGPLLMQLEISTWLRGGPLVFSVGCCLLDLGGRLPPDRRPAAKFTELVAGTVPVKFMPLPGLCTA